MLVYQYPYYTFDLKGLPIYALQFIPLASSSMSRDHVTPLSSYGQLYEAMYEMHRPYSGSSWHSLFEPFTPIALGSAL